jgi:Bacterial protein of unknown function (DUF899)
LVFDEFRAGGVLNARGVSFAILTSGRWDEVAPYAEFMGYTEPWYSVRGVDRPVGHGMGSIASFLRDGERAFITYSTTGRGNERVNARTGTIPGGRPVARCRSGSVPAPSRSRRSAGTGSTADDLRV